MTEDRDQPTDQELLALRDRVRALLDDMPRDGHYEKVQALTSLVVRGCE